MKIFLRSTTLLLVLFQIQQTGFSQCTPQPVINFVNPSFEGTTQAHVTPGPWSVCMNGNTPDTQPGSWGVNLPPSDGTSYLGLIHQPSTGWQEGASEQLSSPFIAGTNYTFTVDLASSSSVLGGLIPGCVELQIWGGFGPCDDNAGTGVLLWSSGNVTPYDTWVTHTVSFTPTQSFTWVMFRVNSLGCTDGPYLMVDNIGPVLPGNVSITTTVADATCAGANNGTSTVHATGQNVPFTYLWSSVPAQTDSVLDNVAIGTYSVTVTDANTCTATAQVTIAEPLPIVLTPLVNNALCGNTGSAYMSYAGGTQPFTFIWSNGTTTQNNGNLFAGTYRITATDANACTATASIVITQTVALSVSGNIASVPTCTTGGSIGTSVSGGTPNYTYSWNTVPVQTSPAPSGLGAGTYTVTVTDANSCTGTASFVMPAPPNAPVVTLTPVDVGCFGQSTGSITSSVTNGTPAYTYSWNTIPIQTTPGITSVAAGNYSVTVTDANSCSISASATVFQPTALTATTTKTDVLCFGQSTGSATVTANGGTIGYTYNWNSIPAQTTPAATNLPAGTFNVTVTDANSCTVTSSAIVNQPASPLSLSETNVDVLCFGGNTGSATVTASGGTAGYTYSWNTTPTQTTPTITSLIAGTYIVTVTDANSCTASSSSVITQPATPVSVLPTVTAPTCFGQPLASATANASGGTAGYTYSWNTVPAQNTQSVSNLPPGNYTVTATDANSCTASASITVAAPPTELIVVTTHTDILCFGDATGTVTANASGSYGGYSYSWDSNPAQTTATATQLIAGTYAVTVTDVQGCSATGSDVISQPASGLNITTTKTDVLCFGDATGSASVTATGGTAGYNYAWSTQPQQTTAAITSLTAGSYDVTVTDANGCSQTGAEIINEPSLLVASQNSTNVTCNGASTGSISITASGGTTAYSYQWSTVPSVNSPTATGLPVGNYSMTVTDANSCTVAINNMSITEPTALTISTTVTDVSCPGNGDGSIATTAGGGVSPYSYAWSNGGNSAINSNLAGGIYDVTLTDNNGCTLSANNLVVIELPAVTMTGIVTDVLCYPLTNGAINVTASTSFPPIQYQWSNGATSANIFSLDTGLYSITVTDAHGCTADSIFHVGTTGIFSIDATPDTITVSLGQTVDLNVTPINGTFGSVIWTPSYGLNCSDCFNPTSSAVESITYRVTGTDVNGCLAYDTVRVNVVPEYVIYIPNAFSPNNDGNNDFFEVFGNKEAWKQFEVQLFNRWGEKVYESNDMNFQWDGIFKGKSMSPTVFVYLVKLVYLDNYTEKIHTGTVTLIR